MSDVQHAIQSLRRAVSILARAQGTAITNENNTLEGSAPLAWSFAIGAADYYIISALDALGDSTLLDERRTSLSAELAQLEAMPAHSKRASP